MRWFICAALCLAWPIAAESWREIEPSLQKIERGLLLIDSSTTGISDYFASERLRLQSDEASLIAKQASLQAESERLAMENDSLVKRGLALTSRETGLEKRGQSLDERAARIDRVAWMLRAAPWVAGGVFAAGVVVGALSSR